MSEMNEVTEIFQRIREQGMPNPHSKDWRERRDARIIDDIIDERGQQEL